MIDKWLIFYEFILKNRYTRAFSGLLAFAYVASLIAYPHFVAVSLKDYKGYLVRLSMLAVSACILHACGFFMKNIALKVLFFPVWGWIGIVYFAYRFIFA